jgi:hypothetical protein
MVKGDALYFLCSAMLAGVIGAGLWLYQESYSEELRVSLAVNGAVGQHR